MRRLCAYQATASSPWMTVPVCSATSVWRFLHLGRWHALAWEVDETVEVEYATPR